MVVQPNNIRGEVASPASVGMDEGALDRNVGGLLKRLVHERQGNNALPNALALVARKGKICFLDHYGNVQEDGNKPVTADTVWRIYSMSKPIVSLALMILVEQGKLLLSDPVFWHLGEKWHKKNMSVQTGGSAQKPILKPVQEHVTVRHLLTHTSGLGYGSAIDPLADKNYPRLDKMDSLAAFVDKLPEFPLSFQPGQHWKYSYSIDVVGHLVAVISGQSLSSFIKEFIFEPLQMTHTSFVLMPGMADDLCDCYLDHPVTGARLNITPFQVKAGSYQEGTVESGGGGLLSTVGDYFRFCQCLMNGGELEGTRVVSRRTVEYMSINHIGDESDNADMYSLSVSDGYTEAPMPGVGMGLGLSVMLNPARAGMMQSKGSIAWGGLAGTTFWCDPAEDLVVIFMTQVIGLNRQRVPIKSLLANVVYSAVVNGKPTGLERRAMAPSL